MSGSAVFVLNGNEVLLVKRRDVPIWVIPGGGIEPGETPEEGAIRETKEETGFDIEITRKVAEYSYKGKETKGHIFEATITGGKARLSNESKEISFFNMNKLPELRHPLMSDWLDDLNKHSSRVIKREISGISVRQSLSHIHKHPLLVIRFLLTRIGIHINT